MDKPAFYRIMVEGQLEPDWRDWFEGMELSSLEEGDTLLTGRIPDQAALHGVLNRIGDLGLVLISVNRAPEAG
jgi:hypothetical protein